MAQLSDIFRPHPFAAAEISIDFYHVYDNLSRTPYLRGIGIECEDPDNYIMDPWHVITPLAMRQHLDWRNRVRTQLISFYDNHEIAMQEAQRRIDNPLVPRVGQRDPDSVRVAHVRLFSDTNVWVFSRDEMLDMMETFGTAAREETFRTSHPDEWFVWGVVRETDLLNRHDL